MDRAGIVKGNTLENLSKTCPLSSYLDLADIWRTRNPTVKRFTWSQNSEEKRHLTGRQFQTSSKLVGYTAFFSVVTQRSCGEEHCVMTLKTAV